MFSLYHYVLFLICFATIASKQFRSDYTYHHSIEGWLKLHRVPATWQDARQLCFLEGAVLASPTNNRMQSALSLEMNKSASDCGIYTGVHSIFSKGYYHSIEGVPLHRMLLPWMPGEPDNADNNENCIAYVTNGSIADVNCSEVLPFICFKKKTDHMTIMPCGTVDKEYEFVAKTGHCYKFHNTLKTWGEGFKVCSAEGAYLAIINSREEATIIKGLHDAHFPNGSRSHITNIGFYDWDQNGVWRTVHGQTLAEAGYADWEKGQPDYAAPGEFCGAIFPNGKLDDFWCDHSAKFLCEKDPESLLDYFSANKK